MTTRGTTISVRRTWIVALVTALAIGLGVLAAHAVPTSLGAGAPAAPATAGYSARALARQAESELAAGHPGPAVLHFERALLLAPRARAVADGLARARAVAGLPAETPALWRRLEHRLAANEWAWIGMVGLVSLAIGLVALAWGMFGRAGRATLLSGGAVLAAVGFVAAAQVAPPARRAIVVAPDVVARIAPFGGADSAFSAAEGSIVTVERVYGDYDLVAGPEGQGWVPRRAVDTILPAGQRRL